MRNPAGTPCCVSSAPRRASVPRQTSRATADLVGNPGNIQDLLPVQQLAATAARLATAYDCMKLANVTHSYHLSFIPLSIVIYIYYIFTIYLY